MISTSSTYPNVDDTLAGPLRDVLCSLYQEQAAAVLLKKFVSVLATQLSAAHPIGAQLLQTRSSLAHFQRHWLALAAPSKSSSACTKKGEIEDGGCPADHALASDGGSS